MERDVIDGDCDGNKVIVFIIPRASYDMRPVYINGNPNKSYRSKDLQCIAFNILVNFFRIRFSDFVDYTVSGKSLAALFVAGEPAWGEYMSTGVDPTGDQPKCFFIYSSSFPEDMTW